jgi:hypothetical protein
MPTRAADVAKALRMLSVYFTTAATKRPPRAYQQGGE